MFGGEEADVEFDILCPNKRISDVKLPTYDFMPSDSLSTLLHGSTNYVSGVITLVCMMENMTITVKEIAPLAQESVCIHRLMQDLTNRFGPNPNISDSDGYTLWRALPSLSKEDIDIMVCDVKQARIVEATRSIVVVTTEKTPIRPGAKAAALGVNRMTDLGVDSIDESKILSSVDDQNFINFWCPFLCGKKLGGALRKVAKDTGDDTDSLVDSDKLTLEESERRATTVVFGHFVGSGDTERGG
ncbi:hypothetical protein SUGI_0218630 [Cryptomeria japonica]|nr:hypothetical protein SUGI_0218630 [Cryptomeria japonica]